MKFTAGSAFVFLVVCSAHNWASAQSPRVRHRYIAPNIEEFVVDTPNVRLPKTLYPEVVFRSGDLWTISATGCARHAAGAFGRHWSRYSNPVGDHDVTYGRLYHGTVSLNDGGDLVEIAVAANSPHWIPFVGGKEQTFALLLGYISDDYREDGYGNHDNGEKDQCVDLTRPGSAGFGGPASVTITIQHNGPEPNYDLDLSPESGDGWDANGYPFNAPWRYTAQHNRLPDPLELCDVLRDSDWPFRKACTSQFHGQDLYEVINAPRFDRLCNSQSLNDATPSILTGHANWRPATYEGILFFEESSGGPLADKDYTLRLYPLDWRKAPFVLGRRREGEGKYVLFAPTSMEVEFDRVETVTRYHTPWWEDLVARVGADSEDPVAVDCVPPSRGDRCKWRRTRSLIDSAYAIVTGLVGLDCVHAGCYTELHPAYALAVRAKSAEPDSSERWAVFARNWGNEGKCASRGRHELTGASSIAIQIPWNANATDVRVSAANPFSVSQASVRVSMQVVQRVGVQLHVFLGDPSSESWAASEVVIEWLDSAGKPITRPPMFPGPPPPQQGVLVADNHAADMMPELDSAIKALPPQQRALVENADRQGGREEIVSAINETEYSFAIQAARTRAPVCAKDSTNSDCDVARKQAADRATLGLVYGTFARERLRAPSQHLLAKQLSPGEWQRTLLCIMYDGAVPGLPKSACMGIRKREQDWSLPAK